MLILKYLLRGVDVKNIIFGFLMIVIISFVFVLLSGCSITGSLLNEDENHCKVDSDCSCGIHATKGDCFVGNKKVINKTDMCSDFCNGLRGGITVKCINSLCELAPE